MLERERVLKEVRGIKWIAFSREIGDWLWIQSRTVKKTFCNDIKGW
jgi:hypothetical protein